MSSSTGLITQPLSHHRQQGLTLVAAVLMVLLLFTLVIGVATLYAGSQKVARGGRLHDEAVVLAEQMAEQIRSNPDARSNFETLIGVTCDSKPSRKDEITRAVACWQEQVATQLTNGSSRISLDNSIVPAEYVIVVSWAEPRTGTASYVMRVPRPRNP